MVNLVDENVVALRIIAKLGTQDNKGSKLYLHSGGPSIHRPGWFSWLYRGSYGESREATYKHVEKVFSTTFQLVDMLLNSTYLESAELQDVSNYQRQKMGETLDTLELLQRELDAALCGVDAMLGLYAHDGAFTSKLEVLKSKALRAVLRTAKAVEEHRKNAHHMNGRVLP
jgi:hypothetical protein